MLHANGDGTKFIIAPVNPTTMATATAATPENHFKLKIVTTWKWRMPN